MALEQLGNTASFGEPAAQQFSPRAGIVVEAFASGGPAIIVPAEAISSPFPDGERRLIDMEHFEVASPEGARRLSYELWERGAKEEQADITVPAEALVPTSPDDIGSVSMEYFEYVDPEGAQALSHRLWEIALMQEKKKLGVSPDSGL